MGAELRLTGRGLLYWALSTGSEEERGLWLTIIPWWNAVGVGETLLGETLLNLGTKRKRWSVGGRGRPILFNPTEREGPIVDVGPIHPILGSGGGGMWSGLHAGGGKV